MLEEDTDPELEPPLLAASMPVSEPSSSRKRRDQGPRDRRAEGERRAPARDPKRAEPPAAPRPSGPFTMPPTQLLAESAEGAIEIDERTLKENAVRLVEKLEAYGVSGQSARSTRSVVTMYEFRTAERHEDLEDRGPLGRSRDGVGRTKGPHRRTHPWQSARRLRAAQRDPPDAVSARAARRRSLAKTGNRAFLAGGVRQGHRRSAGPAATCRRCRIYWSHSATSGSSKSVGLSIMLVSLLMKKSPEDVRLLMIDPKVVELAVFDGIPHMLLPVVTDMKKASLALRWAVDELERRYRLFADAGARNLATYNMRVEKVTQQRAVGRGCSHCACAGKVRALGDGGEELLLDPSDGEALRRRGAGVPSAYRASCWSSMSSPT